MTKQTEAMERALFTPRFNRMEFWGLMIVSQAAHLFQSVEVMLAAVPIVLCSLIGESRLLTLAKKGLKE